MTDPLDPLAQWEGLSEAEQQELLAAQGDEQQEDAIDPASLELHPLDWDARLRQQARDWLAADLALWTRKAEETMARDQVRQRLQHWLNDPDLAGIRDPQALARLPETEGEACRQLWAAVGAVHRKVVNGP